MCYSQDEDSGLLQRRGGECTREQNLNAEVFVFLLAIVEIQIQMEAASESTVDTLGVPHAPFPLPFRKQHTPHDYG